MPSTTDRIKDINRYLGSVNLLPIEIAKSSFETEDTISFDPSKLNTFCPEKKVMTEADVKILEKTTDLSNSNLIRNANGLLSKKRTSEDNSIEWIGKRKKKIPDNKYKMSY